MADYLGTFKYHLEQHLKENSNHTDWQEKQDISNEFINLKDNITTLLKEENKDFHFGKFNNEIDRVFVKREKEYKEEQQKEYDDEMSDTSLDNLENVSEELSELLKI
tara:strand:- start:403 stop:723 length:321 start_codon:yes stop_codon:yes gene_type:complete